MLPRVVPTGARRLAIVAATMLMFSCGGGAPEAPAPKEAPKETDTRPAALRVEPTTLSFSGLVARNDIPGQRLTITNQGGGHLTWTVAVAGQTGWLSVSRALKDSETRGVEGPGKSSTPPLNVSVNTSGLGPGVYNGAIEVSSNAGKATINVTLTLKLGSQG